MALESRTGSHPKSQLLAFPASPSSAATYEFSNEMRAQDHIFDDILVKETPSEETEKMNVRPPPEPDTGRMATLRRKMDEMEEPEKKAKTYQSLTQATIVLSIILCMWPYNLLLLVATFFLSRMVTYRNEEKDYLSARSASYIVLVCNIIALIVGGVITLTIFIASLYGVGLRIHNNHFRDNPTLPTQPRFSIYG